MRATHPNLDRFLSYQRYLLRQLHKLLALRLQAITTFDEFQFGFRPFDGLTKGIHLLDSTFGAAKTNICSLAIAILDLEKAFDTVTHSAIFNSLLERGITKNFSYLQFIYSNAKTILHFHISFSEPILPSRDVRQGDPTFISFISSRF